MPTVAVVEGVKIQFYPRDHPPLHFHAIFAEHRAQIDLHTLRVLKGHLPPAKLRVVVAWAEPRRATLIHTWDEVMAKRKPEKIR
jgi:uncharacterized protein DUF4160